MHGAYASKVVQIARLLSVAACAERAFGKRRAASQAFRLCVESFAEVASQEEVQQDFLSWYVVPDARRSVVCEQLRPECRQSLGTSRLFRG